LGSPATYDTIIIGAGMSGLSAGIRLAHFGKKVAILERHDRPGGLNSYYTLNGYDIDVGLHAVTNFAKRKSPTSALSKIYRQLRIKPEDFDLSPQIKSRISFPSTTLDFTNDFNYLTQEIADKFPAEIDNFQKLVKKIGEFNPFNTDSKPASTREMLSSIIQNELLIEMLLAPLMYYGNPTEHDMEYRQFVIMFQSIYLEGFSRPRVGVRQILKVLTTLLEDKGCELLYNSGVEKLIIDNGKAIGVELYDGSTLKCKNILSSIGRLETINICKEAKPDGNMPTAGKMSFMESINILDESPKELGFEHSIIFYSNREKFVFECPDKPVDPDDGVICVPDNFDYKEPLHTNMVRITNRADYRFWENINPMENLPKKRECHKLSLTGASKHCPSIDSHIKFTDIFTPRTVTRFTGHLNGAVYGSPEKIWDGSTPVENLYLCGTDQGFLGIIGTMLSGISIANQYLLK